MKYFYIWICYFLHYSLGKHIALHGIDFSENFQGQSVIDKPWNISCSIPICEGPLAQIYCSGALIEATWRFGLQDSCPGTMLKHEPELVLANFQRLAFPLKREDFKSFCDDNFERQPYLELTRLPDYVENATFLERIKDKEMREFALLVHRRWKTLARRFIPEVRTNPTRFPVLPVPNPFIVPGGFFQVYFYWDSYWIMKGLLVSNMTTTVKGMLLNFGFIIDNHGFIPNSGNIQLSRRSQPPLFAQMLSDYYNATRDKDFLRQMLPTLEKELQFWRTNRTVIVPDKGGKNHILYQYRAITTCPRPENFLVDVENGISGSYEPEAIWGSIASACESGWDFSARWFDHHGTKAYSKYSIRTNSLVPVDVNAFMAWNFKAVAGLFTELGEQAKSIAYENEYTRLVEDMKILWNEDRGIWQDLDLTSREYRDSFYPSNLYPLLALKASPDQVLKIKQYLHNTSVFSFPGGIPSTLPVNSSQQWDFPNVWAPNVQLVVQSLLNTGDAWLSEKATEAAKRFVITVKNGLLYPKPNMTATIWEKYDARFSDGTRGDGGEYTVQEGFGWTNGAILHFINEFMTEAGGLGEIETNDVISDLRRLNVPDLSPSIELSAGLKEFFNNGAHTIIVLSVIVTLMLLIIWFTICGVTSGRALSFRRQVAAPESSRLLLSNNDESD